MQLGTPASIGPEHCVHRFWNIVFTDFGEIFQRFHFGADLERNVE